MASTVLTATRDVMRELGLTIVFGNPGSTEQPFLKDWPSDFTYVFGLHEGPVVGMADGYARAMRKAVLVNLHTAAGVGNAMGAIATAWHNKAPLVVTAGRRRLPICAAGALDSGPARAADRLRRAA